MKETERLCRRLWARVLTGHLGNLASHDKDREQLLQFLVSNPGLLKFIGTKMLLFCSVPFSSTLWGEKRE